MYCRNCGKEIDDKAIICVHCGVATDNMAQMNYGRQSSSKRVNGLALAGMIVSIIGLMGGSFIPGVVGLVLSIVGLNKVKEYNSGKGFAIAGIIVGAVAIVIWALYWICTIIEYIYGTGYVINPFFA